MVMMLAKKVTVFEGYISGDYECFCLSKVPFKEWVENQRELHKIDVDDEEAFWKWHKKAEDLTLYPSNFFPKECTEGKWQFKISVEAKRVNP